MQPARCLAGHRFIAPSVICVIIALHAPAWAAPAAAPAPRPPASGNVLLRPFVHVGHWVRSWFPLSLTPRQHAQARQVQLWLQEPGGDHADRVQTVSNCAQLIASLGRGRAYRRTRVQDAVMRSVAAMLAARVPHAEVVESGIVERLAPLAHLAPRRQ